MVSSDREVLKQAFMAAQDISMENADDIAQKLLADVEIGSAANHWALTGKFPEEPEISGQSPLTLSKKYRPTQVFTILLGLKRDPIRAERMLRSYGPGSNEHLSLP